MFIGKAAQLSGTTIKAIRHYEAIGLLPAPQRQGQYRVYSEQNVELLMFIKCAQQLGFKLKELQEILHGHRGDELPWQPIHLPKDLGEVHQYLADLLRDVDLSLSESGRQCRNNGWCDRRSWCGLCALHLLKVRRFHP